MAVAELLAPKTDRKKEIDYTEVDLPQGYELIDGKLVEMPKMGFKASSVASELHVELANFLRQSKLGKSFTAEASFKCFKHKPRNVRKPDVSVILCDPETFVAPDPHCAIVPAVAVEVVSPREKADDLMGKIRDYLHAGTRLVWEIRPAYRCAVIHYPDLTTRQINEDGVLTGEDVLPGFSVPLKAILPKQV